MRIKYIALVMGLLLLSIACSEKRMRTQEEAEKLAMNMLEKYAKKENLSLAIFKPSSSEKTYYDKDVQVWMMYYDSDNKPRHRINILVDQFGNTELHREIEK